MSIKIERKVVLPQGITAEIKGLNIKIQGPKGTVERQFRATGIEILKGENELIVKGNEKKKVIGAKAGALQAHLKNMVDGAEKGFISKLAVVYSHFPMNVSVKENRVEITNFTGEKQPRIAKIVLGTKVSIKGKDITVEGNDIEAVGQTAANMEQATKVRNKDRRIYFDGIYITEKAHKVL